MIKLKSITRKYIPIEKSVQEYVLCQVILMVYYRITQNS